MSNTPSKAEIEALVKRHGATSYRNRADTQHPAYGFTEDGLNGLIDEVLAKWAAPKQEAQEPCPTCAALARTVMLDQVSFDRKPDCYGIRQITDDEGIEEWEDIRTSPDVAREEANDMTATGRGEIYEVVPLYTAPQPAPAPLSEMPYEKRKAIQEGEQISASDAWFHARINMLDTLDRRNVFRAGFDRGWNAALAAQGGE